MDRWQSGQSYSRTFGLLIGLLAVYELYIYGSLFAESRASSHEAGRSCVTKHGMSTPLLHLRNDYKYGLPTWISFKISERSEQLNILMRNHILHKGVIDNVFRSPNRLSHSATHSTANDGCFGSRSIAIHFSLVCIWFNHASRTELIDMCSGDSYSSIEYNPADGPQPSVDNPFGNSEFDRGELVSDSCRRHFSRLEQRRRTRMRNGSTPCTCNFRREPPLSTTMLSVAT